MLLAVHTAAVATGLALGSPAQQLAALALLALLLVRASGRRGGRRRQPTVPAPIRWASDSSAPTASSMRAKRAST